MKLYSLFVCLSLTIVSAAQKEPDPTVVTEPAPGIFRIFYQSRVSLVAFTGEDGLMLMDARILSGFSDYGKWWITENDWIDTVTKSL